MLIIIPESINWSLFLYFQGTGINNGGLYIKQAQFYHEGRYTCVVESSSEKIERSMDLYVHGTWESILKLECGAIVKQSFLSQILTIDMP